MTYCADDGGARLVALWLGPAAPLLALRCFPAVGFGLVFVFVASGAALCSAVCGPLALFLPAALVAPSFPSVVFTWVAAGFAWAWVGPLVGFWRAFLALCALALLARWP